MVQSVSNIEQKSSMQLYKELQVTANKLTTSITDGVITPVAKKHFEEERGHKITQTLPDKTRDYAFDSHGFTALVLPDERKVINESYKETVISPNGVMRYPDKFNNITTQAESLWKDTFGEWKKHQNQPNHPGPFPLVNTDIQASVTEVIDVYEVLGERNPLPVIKQAAQNNNHALLSEVFNTTENEILTPGGDDLSALVLMNSYTMPYNDGNLALIAPETRSGANAQRGVIIGHDDTPTGVFAHVTDVTNLDQRKQITHDMIRSAMGFDREIDPWEHTDRLEIATGGRVRLQGDLRIECISTDIDVFPDRILANTLQKEYESVITTALDGIAVPARYIRGRQSDLPVTQIFNIDVSPNRSVVLDPQVADSNIELLGYAAILLAVPHEDVGYEAHSDIPYIIDPWRVQDSIAKHDVETTITKARRDVQPVIQSVISAEQDQIEQRAEEAKTEAETSMEVPRQVNLPVDNHLVLIESGFAPDVDVEPVPVGIPTETTLHIEHGEHNTINLTLPRGVYRFSLLPRGLQPRETRPEW